jgi:hypothetical protein
MGHLMPYKPSKIEHALQGKFDFTLSDRHSPDHRWYELSLPGLPIIATRVSHSKKEIGPKLEGKIARQLRVPTQFFREMIDCTKNREDYYTQVREAPYPPWDVRF